MHEASIMQNVFATAFEHMHQAGAVRIQRLRLRVGALSGVVPDALTFAFEALKTNTAAAEAELEIDRVPARLLCMGCLLDFDSDTCVDLCPRCGSWQTSYKRAPASS